METVGIGYPKLRGTLDSETTVGHSNLHGEPELAPVGAHPPREIRHCAPRTDKVQDLTSDSTGTSQQVCCWQQTDQRRLRRRVQHRNPTRKVQQTMSFLGRNPRYALALLALLFFSSVLLFNSNLGRDSFADVKGLSRVGRVSTIDFLRQTEAGYQQSVIRGRQDLINKHGSSTSKVNP